MRGTHTCLPTQRCSAFNSFLYFPLQLAQEAPRPLLKIPKMLQVLLRKRICLLSPETTTEMDMEGLEGAAQTGQDSTTKPGEAHLHIFMYR